MSDLLKLISIASVVFGPFASGRVPAMAPDIRPWAFWISGIAALCAWLWATAVLSGQRKRSLAKRILRFSAAITLASALIYYFINLVWVLETGDWRDTAFQVALVLVYSLGCASLTVAAVASQRLTKAE